MNNYSNFMDGKPVGVYDVDFNVVYTGDTQSYHSCSDPSILQTDRVYSVKRMDIGKFHTNIELAGVKGSFNSCWFEEAISKNTCMGLIKTIPQIGERLLVLECDNGVELNISTVVDIKVFGEGAYYVVETKNTIYLLKKM